MLIKKCSKTSDFTKGLTIFTNKKAQLMLCDYFSKVKRSKGAELQTQLDMSESFIFRPSVPSLGFFVSSKVEKIL